jgi:spiro-SPASM protein
MRTLILDGLFVYKDLPRAFGGLRSIDIIFNKAVQNGFERFILLQNGKVSDVPQGIKNVVLTDYNLKDILAAILEESRNSDEVVVFNAASPFYDSDFTAKMLETHGKYLADYTYALGYPEGLIPAVIRKDILKELIPLVEEETELKRDYLFQAISKDINSFDIETILADSDLRIFRASFGLADAGEEIFTEKVYNFHKDNIAVEKINEYLSKNPQELSTVIYLLTLELTNHSAVSSIYSPVKSEEKRELSFDTVKKAISFLKKNNENAHVILGGEGEPMEHPQFVEIAEYIAREGFEVIVESAFNNIDNKICSSLDNIKDRIIFVAKQDAYFEETYKTVHPEGVFGNLQENIKLAREAGFKVYRQIVRMNENEVEIEKFVRAGEVGDLIVKKYSTYCGAQPDRKVVDLSPLERIPCFHLRRELFIRSDGKVPACLFSRFEAFTAGDAVAENLDEITEKISRLYSENSAGKYMDFCKECGDYYIFNF